MSAFPTVYPATPPCDTYEEELAATIALYNEVLPLQKQVHRVDREAAISKFPTSVPDWQVAVLIATIMQFDNTEEPLMQIMQEPVPPFEARSKETLHTIRQFLYRKKHYFENPQAYDELMKAMIDRLGDAVLEAGRQPFISGTDTSLSTTLINAVADPKAHIRAIADTIRGYPAYFLFWNSALKLNENVNRVSGFAPKNLLAPISQLIQPAQSKSWPDKMRDEYLSGTPFWMFYNAPVPVKLDTETRMSHMHVVGGAGAGKTTLLEQLFLDAVKDPAKPSVVVVDPHSDLIQKLIKADLGIEDRIIYINPKDTNYPPALNIFALNRDRFDSYDPATREQVMASVIQTFDYLFTGLVGADLTAKQSTFFRYMARLMLSLPDSLGRNATVLDLLRLMTDDSAYKPAIERLDPIPREFFERDFTSKTFSQTREQIRYRLQAILENPTLARLFTQPETKLDFFTELDRGSIILIDTAQDFLKDGSAVYGRLFISLVLQAVLERAAIPESKRRDTFLMVDEAAAYFDSNIDDLLTQVRKYRCGCVFAHQYLDQATSSLRASLAANTAIKFASGLSAGDARAMAPDMRTTADFILAQKPLTFAAYMRGQTREAIPIEVKRAGDLPQLSPAAYDRFIERNRQRISSPQQPVAQSPSPPVSEDLSKEW